MGPLQKIRVLSLEEVQARYDFREAPENYPAGRLDEFQAVRSGRAALVLPDGRRYWLPVLAAEAKCNLQGDTGADLLSAVYDHNANADHDPCNVFFDADTNDLATAYCEVCGKYVDLTEDVRKMDAKSAPGAQSTRTVGQTG